MAFIPESNERRMKQDALQRLQESRSEDSGNGCYLFIRFPASSHNDSNVHEVGKACVLAKKTMGSGGRFLGIARKVFSYGYENRDDEACVVFLFPSRTDAELFFQSDPNFKQPDFPRCAGYCQAWVVDRYYTPDNEQTFNTFMMSEIRLKPTGYPYQPGDSYMRYKETVATPFANLLLRHDAQPYVVQTHEVIGLRRFFKEPKHIVTVHLFRSPTSLEEVMNDRMYEQIEAVKQNVASEIYTVFTIDSRACP